MRRRQPASALRATAWQAVASAAAYFAVTAVLGRDLLGQLSTHIANDEGDPLFVASILHWNATRLPFSDGWWQLPIFHPTRDTLTFSEHFLGLAPLSTPLQWITRDAVVTYNLVALLTFPLCGLAMFALAHRVTRSGAAAFLAGLAFAFAPYRMSQLPHLQMLAFFWAPLALLGLHGYVETGRWRWLALYGAAWMLQCASNAYTLVFLSVLIAFWVIWFVIARRRWSALAGIAAATLIAALPLVPILANYVSVHAQYGFTRDPAEVRAYSADLAGILCAPGRLTFWGWLQTGCRPEGEIFPGLTVAVVSIIAAVHMAMRPAPDVKTLRSITLLSRAFLLAALVFAAAACSVMVAGPWRVELGPVRISVSSMPKPVMLATITMLIGFILSPGIRAGAQRASTSGFYAVAAIITWALALGPVLTLMNEARGFQAPFALLMSLPGVGGLRVPARFWLLTTMCLAVVIGALAATLLERRSRTVTAAGVTLGALLLLSDGWIDRIRAAAVERSVPDARLLANTNVLTLPMGSLRDIAAGFRAVTGGWRSINGYSGYFPPYYIPLLDAARDEEDGVLNPYVARGDLYLVVAESARRLRDMVERQPGVTVIARDAGAVQYRIPRRAAIPHVDASGSRLGIRNLRASCQQMDAGRVVDGDPRTLWECGPQRPGHEIVADLGSSFRVGALVHDLAEYNTNYPRHLVVETSVNGSAWDAAWNGSVRGLLIAQAIERPGPTLRFAVPLGDRDARYIRLRQTATADLPWSIAELEVRATPERRTKNE